MSVDLLSDASPSARAWPFIASAGDLVYLWGGEGDTEPEDVFLFHRNTKTWARQRTRGPHPPAGLRKGGCCISGQHLYIYGGEDGKSRYGTLYELNTNSWTWRKLSDGGAGGPGKKSMCRMIPYHDKLLVVGGLYYGRPSSRQAGSSYERGWTNEVHCFNLTTGLWSSPSMKGTRPPPCCNFSLTVTDEDQAVMFGGYTPSGKSSKAHILHLPTMTWTKHTEGDPWPWRRHDHIAACLGYGEQYKALLISGGSCSRDIHDDMWLLDPQSGRMEELQVPERNKKLIQRQSHGAATLTVNSDCVEVILFGGYDDDDSLLADTTILTFVRKASAPEGVSPAQRWILTDVDEIKKKQDASDKSASESFKATDLSSSHGDPESTKEDDDKVNNDVKKSIPVEMMTEEMQSELLKEYPQLPVARQSEVDTTITHSGFAVEKEISVAYKGEKSSIIWREGGILMKLEEDKDHRLQDATKFSIQKFSSEGSYSRLPSNSEVASQVYFINTSKPLKRTATIRIYHQAREVDIDQLCFLTSIDEQPPYDFNILKGGHFTSAYGENTVERFSFFTICRLVKQLGFRGVLYYMEKSYEASLYHSLQPSSRGSKFQWNLYLSVTKNCHVFRSCLKDYIKEEYKEDVKLVDKCIVKLNRAVNTITVSTSLGTSPPSQDEVCLREPGTTSLKKSNAKNYTDGCPPAFVYRLLAMPNSKFKLDFEMKGFEESCKFSLHQDDLQELCSSTSQITSCSLSSGITDSISSNLMNQDLSKVFDEVHDAKAQWKVLGLMLGVTIGELDAIELMGSNVDNKLMTMLAKWLQSGNNVTWSDLAEAMGANTAVGREDLRQKLIAKYC